MTPEQRKNISRLLKPRHIAFVGGDDAAVAIGEATRIGYSGDIWAVNTQRKELAGFACFASIDDLPEAPDAVFLAIPTKPAIELIRQLRDKGAGGVVCYTAGFSEAGEKGRAAEQALISAAGDMALLGPNCYGLINYLDHVALWPFAQGGSSPGYGCAIVTQSGMLSSDLTMSQRSVPLTHMISIGNQAVLSLEDLVDILCEDDRVRAIGLHIEGLKDVGKFARAAVKATTKGIPIVALKTGSSLIGKALANSHTGSISGEDNLYDALFQRTGVVRVYSPSQLLETLKFVCLAGLPEGHRLAGFTCSGGGATMLADHAEKIGLEFSAYSPSTAGQLKSVLPSIATVSNPLDYTTPIWGQSEKTKPVFTQALADDYNAAILVQDYPAAGLDESKHYYLADARAFSQAAAEAGIPAAICSTLPENLDRQTRDDLIVLGVAPMQGILECLEAVAGAGQWRAMQTKIVGQPPGELVAGLASQQLRALDESESKHLLVAAGIDVPESEVCNFDDLAAAAIRVGFPLVLKMVHQKLLHKTEAAAVQLNLTSIEQVEKAAIQMATQVQARQPEALSDRYLLEAMQPPPLAELVVSIRHDTQFGLALTLGCGGLLVELVEDTATLLLPATSQEFIAMIQSLKVYRLLEGYRGQRQANLTVLTDLLNALQHWMYDNIETVGEIEINPLFVYQNRVCAVDALIHIKL